MALPAIIGLISKILGGVSAAKSTGEGGGQSGGYEYQPRYGTIGQAAGEQRVQPQQVEQGQPSTQGQQQNPPQGGGGFNNFANKVGTIASLIESIRGSGQQQSTPYQMTLNRNRR